MTTYYGLYGQKVQYLASDPTDVQIGQVWYNSTSATLKVRQSVATNSWATGGNLGTPRYSSGAAGTQTAALLIAGQDSVPNLSISAVEAYNGTSWTSATSYPATYFQIGGAGTQTAALSAGGQAPALTDETNIYNGTSWTTVPGTLVTARTFQNRMFGTQTSALAISGATPNSVQSYNGTTWTVGTSMNTTRFASAFGDSNQSGVAFGGPPAVTSTEIWNGTTWTNNPTGLNTGRASAAGFGTTASGLAAGGDSGSVPTDQATEEWTGTQILTRTVTVT